MQSEIFKILAQRAAPGTCLSYADYLQTVLYDPLAGYYRKEKTRVGKAPGTDFFTASSLGPIFADLVVEAVCNRLAPGNPSDYAFVEVGIEPEGGILRGRPHPFASYTAYTVGTTIDIPPRAVVFSNELLDAQPFHRVRFLGNCWQECGVRVGDAALEEAILDEFTPSVAAISNLLPGEATEGYTIDLPLGAEHLLHGIAETRWSGLWLTFDYGTTWRELATAFPTGTGRSYRHHQIDGNLLASPGERDITCHLCWDQLTAVLRNAGFDPVGLERQEAFFVHYASPVIEDIMKSSTGTTDRSVSVLRELLHPAQMGAKFQAHWGVRSRI